MFALARFAGCGSELLRTVVVCMVCKSLCVIEDRWQVLAARKEDLRSDAVGPVVFELQGCWCERGLLLFVSTSCGGFRSQDERAGVKGFKSVDEVGVRRP